MTQEQAKSELMQIYMSLSEEKKKALDVAFKAMEQAQADGEYISKSDMIDWLKDIRHKMKPQNYHTASEFEIAENQIWNLIQMLQMGAFPTVVIPSAEPSTVNCNECSHECPQWAKNIAKSNGCIGYIPSAEPKTVEYTGDGYADGEMVYDMAECPNCGREFEDGDETWNCNFCPDCGQALEWEGEQE